MDYVTGFNKHSKAILPDPLDDELSELHLSSKVEEDVVKSKEYADMPIDIKLKILAYLDTVSLCSASQVSQSWAQMACDHYLWERKLHCESKRWEIIDRSSHPLYYRETCPRLTSKQVYCYCYYQQKENQSFSTSLNFTKLRYQLGLYLPRIVLFGSGLDSCGLVSKILVDAASPFKVKGMFPGQFEGMGSGVSLQYRNEVFNIITLYALSKAERESDVGKEKQSRLLVEGSGSDGDAVTISQPVQQLCSTIDCFIYVIDSSNEETVTFRVEEFKAMMDDRWLKSTARLLVLCVSPDSMMPSVSSLEVADQLNMLQFSRPWQVRQCHINNLDCFIAGLQWGTAHVCTW